MSENWVIARKPDGTVPTVGQVYEIRDSRKGTFTGRIIDDSGYWARVEVLAVKIHWASKENHIFNRNPDVVNIRASLVYLIEIEDDNPAP